MKKDAANNYARLTGLNQDYLSKFRKNLHNLKVIWHERYSLGVFYTTHSIKLPQLN